ncbi:MAG: DUF4157 domain-containing protein [Anaerolineae bacterium]|nr:DUF4157 domain-containing protein [Thermoflexales bacterium]MDW8406732.1 DUF4157 domain-containing protein [Anaerolineae bacterium]
MRRVRSNVEAERTTHKNTARRSVSGTKRAGQLSSALSQVISGGRPVSAIDLQRTAGNRAVNRLIQTKLIVGPADDPYEREAERIAAQFGAPVSAADPPARRIQALPQTPAVGPEGGEAGADIERELAASKGAGAPLPPETRTLMENHFGADFSDVRVHTGAQADMLNRQLGAQAFTWGSDIYMGDGKYNPASRDGRRLLAHELTHVVQQSGGARRQVRRLMSTNLLKALAGEPHRDRTLGKLTIRKMSAAYKAVLSAIDHYHGQVSSIPVSSLTQQQEQAVYRLLDEVEQACRAYLRKHPSGQRTQHVQAVLDSIPAEREAIQQIAGNPQAYPYTLRNAIERVGNTPVVTQVSGMMATASNRQMREANEERAKEGKPALNTEDERALLGAALQSYESDMDAILGGVGQKAPRAPNAFDWRGNTTTTKIGSAFGAKVGQDYFRNAVAPELNQALSLPDSLAEVDPDKVEPARLQANVARMRSIYQSFMRLFTSQGAQKVPLLMAKFCADLYALARSKQMSEEDAYLLVSSQLFLRTINPMLAQVTAAISQGKPGKRAIVLLSKLVQDDANNIPHGQREPFMAVFNETYQAQVREFVQAVIARGQG